MPTTWNRPAAIDALRALLPLTPPVPIFGLVFGLAVVESVEVGSAAGWASSLLVFGGASQLAAVVVIDAGGTALVAIGTIVVVNARHVMYSAALRARFADAPTWFRVVGPYFLVDQVFAITETRPADDPVDYRLTHFVTGGLYWLVWWTASVAVGTIIGLTAGDVIPAGWSLEFSVPLLFLGLLVNAIRDRPGLVAAAVAATMAVVAGDLDPPGTGLLVAAAAGLAAGALADEVDGRSGAGPAGPGPGSGADQWEGVG